MQDRRICVVTTAALPWRTGTSINPLARALYLTRQKGVVDVTLFIPWLNDPNDQAMLFGNNDISFQKEAEQEEWIRQYCKDRIHCEDEAKKLQIRFYPAMYSPIFASIFPIVDICSLIPTDQADIAILEEPEHLNWFRVPSSSPKVNNDNNDSSNDNNNNNNTEIEKETLGWAAKFRLVIGIIHTNYAAYIGGATGSIGSFFTGPSLNALSSLVVRAYCHRVIRLSDTLPVLYKEREVTCNVHGVRSEFFLPTSKMSKMQQQQSSSNTTTYSPIYFIGKFVWAKGFDKLLDIQDKYRAKMGQFFAIDIYGSGPDGCAIERAFLGRKGLLLADNDNNNNNKKEEKKKDATTRSNQVARTTTTTMTTTNEQDEIASLLFSEPISLKEQLTTTTTTTTTIGGSSSSSHQNHPPSIDELPNLFSILGDAGGRTLDAGTKTASASTRLGEKLFDIGFRATFLEEDSMGMPSIPSNIAVSSSGTEQKKTTFHFRPVQTRFELRRVATPTRFLGVKDHAALRDVIDHKIFLNVSETEVLCTTTAEALAMGKFVIIPIHPSNEFFLPFSNCLGFSSQEDCVDKICWALDNEPTPLTEEEAYKLTWEGAIDRLIAVSGLDNDDSSSSEEEEVDFDRDAARLHADSMGMGHAALQLVNRN